MAGRGVHFPAADIFPPLAINELRLCRKVIGFGSFEPLGTTAVKAGQPLLIYCETDGVQYEADGVGFRSRLSSKLEIIAAGGEPGGWEHELGVAVDVCRRERHDYFASYRLEVPSTLPPGRYRLRITQTDLVTGSRATAEMGIEVSR
jgi:hypothetical protein